MQQHDHRNARVTWELVWQIVLQKQDGFFFQISFSNHVCVPWHVSSSMRDTYYISRVSIILLISVRNDKVAAIGALFFPVLACKLLDQCSSPGVFSILCLIYPASPAHHFHRSETFHLQFNLRHQMDRAIPRSHNTKDTALPFKEAESSISSLCTVLHTRDSMS
jgi:hypothetical protein